MSDLRQLVDQALAGRRRAIGRLLTAVEAGGERSARVADLTARAAVESSSRVVGITGSPGSGKSTLVGQLVVSLAEAGQRPAVIAVDPSSPLTGGAIWGDRVRMDEVVNNPDVFIRSMATRGHQGGLALAVPGAVRVLAAVGFDPIIIETVGVGQVEVDVVSVADTAVVVMAPGLGDAVQANKAGLLEVADLFVVNKADRPGASDVRRDLELMLELSRVSGAHDHAQASPEIIMTTALDGTGVKALTEALAVHQAWLAESGNDVQRQRDRLRSEVRAHLLRRAEARVDALIADPVVFADPGQPPSPLVERLDP